MVRGVREGLVAGELAEESGLHRTYVSGVERGVRNPTVTIIGKLALALGASPGDFFRGK